MTKKIDETLERRIREEVARHEEEVRKNKLQAGALPEAKQGVSKIPVLHHKHSESRFILRR
ncbi:MAG TPA: hypothetical protein VK675_01075 [Candidatus Paceibacterota bacterium]|nr:hypothetical protein [Candidatus Paceibacterota bacterium]